MSKLPFDHMDAAYQRARAAAKVDADCARDKARIESAILAATAALGPTVLRVVDDFERADITQRAVEEGDQFADDDFDWPGAS